MKIKRKPVEDRKSFIGEISPKNNLASRTMTALITGQLAGKFMGPFLPWGIVIYDGLFRKKPTSLKNFGDYMVFKASAALMNPQEIEYIWNFTKEKYQVIQPYLEHFFDKIF